MTNRSRAPRPTGRRLTIRTRLTLSYAGLVTGSGVVLIAIVYLYMRFVPTYRVVGEEQQAEVPTAGASGPTDAIAVVKADDFLDNLVVASLLALLVMALVGAAVGRLIARRIVRPLGDIGDAARRATEGSLEHRVDLDGPSDEIQNLADAFNHMLDSLERSFATQRRFTANASHELQSPLATIKAMIDVTRSDPSADLDDLRGLVDRISDVNRSTIETVDAMLDLADAEHAMVALEPVDLLGLARTVVADLHHEVTSSEVAVQTAPGRAVALGSPALLRQAISNLTRNAIRHNDTRAKVAITASSAEEVRLSIANTGPLLTPADLRTLVEPFARGAGRSLTRGRGHGLGLAIAVAAVAASGGRLVLEPNPDGGLTAALVLPSADDLAPESVQPD